MPQNSQAVDMIEVARQTTMRDIAHVMPGAIKIIAPAKVNLFLGVSPKRGDGFHDVHNVMHALTLHDVVYMAPASEMSVTIIPTGGFIVPEIEPEDNLAVRAVRALGRAVGCAQEFNIRIEKNIPAQAGLGGGSTDAAAALLGAAHFWGLAADDARLLEVAANLGADVAFFLQGGCACMSGKGEVLEKTYTPSKDCLVLLQPETGLSTAAVYNKFDELRAPVTQSDIDTVLSASTASEIPYLNSLQAPAEALLPELQNIREWLSAQPGVARVQLTGSGSVVFAQCSDFASASKIAGAAKLKGIWARTTSLSSAKVAIVPTK